MNIRMGTKGKRPLRSLTPRDKIHAIQRIHDGESKASVARDIGVPESTLRGWCKNEDKLRFMSRQSAADKMCADALVDKLEGGGGGGVGGGGSAGLLGPPEKRPRLEHNSSSGLPLNFSNKLNFDELAFKRSPLNGLDYSTNKGLSDIGYNGLPVDYVGFKSKVFGADISRSGPADPSLNAISPLSSLTHLSGLGGISQSPLAISFNELTSNLNLLAQLNPGLAAMSGLNSFAATANTLRNPQKPTGPNGQQQEQSPRSESGDRERERDRDRERTPALSVKNWAKQKPAGSNSTTAGDCETNLGSMKSPSPSLAPLLVGCVAPLSGLPDDPLLYWLKSQQAMLGLNSLYPPPQSAAAAAAGMGVTSPPIRSSTPQQMNPYPHTPPMPSATSPAPAPAAPGTLDEKHSAWYNWCKAFGASLHSTLNPNAATLAALQQHQAAAAATTTTAPESTHIEDNIAKQPYDNILYSQLTKEAESPSVRSVSSSNEAQPTELEAEPETDAEVHGKPEDLSAKSVKSASSSPSPILAESVTPNPVTNSREPSPELNSGADEPCKNVLSNIIYKIGGAELDHDSEASFNSETQQHQHHNNNDVSASNNNNNNSNKTDEEERAKYADIEELAAIRHGEKFLQWLENCSNPRVTAVQLMQLRFLIAAIKSGSDAQTDCVDELEDAVPEADATRNKTRRRK
ncbi:protein distal antenna [Drosophila grimshawi]|uniref:GH18053 n=1 Tax=Drosophila grimshawi TaxID=7222 RepID=B4JHN7_DROGR|nr:protein distal antenna [Drosophila grimshawi]EDV93876.1 GH18053 [Drosophila grimshawi]